MNTVSLKKDSFRIVQFTDLHLMNRAEDLQTYQLMHQTIETEHPDMIVITGDITMVPDNEALLIQLREVMESYHRPWAFVFGNHDYESSLSLDEQANILMKGQHCLFEKGNPQLRGLGNYYIALKKQDKIIAMLGFLDSHNNRIDEINGEKIWSYDYLDKDQIDDAVKNVNSLKEKTEQFSSLFFFHIPLVDFKTEIEEYPENCMGACFEEISCSKYDTHFSFFLEQTNTLRGVFVGHDHVCDYQFVKNGCLYAFGRCTGHYNYTKPEFVKGCRIIDIDALGNIKSHVILEG